MLAYVTHDFSTVLMLLILLIAQWFDFKQHRIPNLLTYGTMLTGLVLQSWLLGLDGFLTALYGFGVGLLVLLPFFLGGGMGAGDIKMMAALGTLLGPMDILLAAGVTLIAGSALGLLILIVRRGSKRYFSRYFLILKHLFYTGKLMYFPPAQGEAATLRFPYAVAIATGCVVTLWWTSALDFTFLKMLIASNGL